MSNDHKIVLDFWFGGDQSFNYKTKWFPTGSKEVQHAADLQVTTLFQPLLFMAMSGELADWANDPKSHLALIIVLDQFSRHIFRFQELPSDAECRQTADSLALSHAECITATSDWDATFSTAEYVFAMMPFRHTATVPRLTSLLDSIAVRESAGIEAAELLSKFRKQTTRRLQHLQDRSKVCHMASDTILTLVKQLYVGFITG